MPLVCILKWSILVNWAVNTVVYRHENDGEMCDSGSTLLCVRLTCSVLGNLFGGDDEEGNNFETVKWLMPLERAINILLLYKKGVYWQFRHRIVCATRTQRQLQLATILKFIAHRRARK